MYSNIIHWLATCASFGGTLAFLNVFTADGSIYWVFGAMFLFLFCVAQYSSCFFQSVGTSHQHALGCAHSETEEDPQLDLVQHVLGGINMVGLISWFTLVFSAYPTS